MIRRILHVLGSLRVTVVGLLLLLILTVWGTLYQVEHGLYGAQERFYQSWFLLIGPVPFPGAQLVMTVLFVNLLAAILVLALKGRLRWGMIVTHFGLLLMLAAGAVTFYLGSESHLSLVEGESSNVALSYNEWELALLPHRGDPDQRISALPARALRPGRTIKLPGDGNVSLRVETFHRNCVAMRGSLEDPPINAGGHVSLDERPLGKEPGAYLPGVIFTLMENGREQGRYLLWGGDPAPTHLHTESDHRFIGLRRQRVPLPAIIQLLDFRREMHPGSGIAKSYSSQVLVRSGGESDRKVLISMNKPLRLRGFTFYQSSFSSAPGGQEISTLSVVHNYGRTMPYLATGITSLGMLLHFAGILITRLRHRPAAEEDPS